MDQQERGSPTSVPAGDQTGFNQPQVVVALIGALGGVAVAAVTGVFTVLAGWVQLGGPASPGPVPTVTVTVDVGSGADVSDSEGDGGDAGQETDGPSGDADVTYLAELNPVDVEGEWRVGEVTLEGRTFRHGMVASTLLCRSHRTYRLDGTHERFRADAGISATDGLESATVFVVVDGVQVWSGQIVAGELLPIDVDVHDARELQILLDHSCGGSILGLGDPRLVGEP